MIVGTCGHSWHEFGEGREVTYAGTTRMCEPCEITAVFCKACAKIALDWPGFISAKCVMPPSVFGPQMIVEVEPPASPPVD